MKKLKTILLGITLLFSGAMISQVSVNVNIGSPPLWGPVGYTEVRYYYLPDVEAYYDIHTSMFIYYGGGIWLHKPHLPGIYSSYDLYGGYKVVMTDYHGDKPYTNFHEYKRKYAKGYKGGSQKTIGEKPGKGNSNHRSSSEGQNKQVKNNSDNNHNNVIQKNNKSNSPAPKQNQQKQQNHGGNGKKK
jgi:hypothetical protein